MIKIQIASSEVQAIRGVSSKTNRPYEFFKQEAYAFLPGKPYPEKVELPLESQRAYPIGDYTLDEASIYVDRNNRLQINPVLVRSQVPQAVPATSKPAA